MNKHKFFIYSEIQIQYFDNHNKIFLPLLIIFVFLYKI